MAHVRNAPSRGSRPIAPPQWSIDDGDNISTSRNADLVMATGVLADSHCYASPDLLPGQTLELSGTTLSIVSDATVPTVNGDDGGSVLDLISAREIVVEAIDASHLHAQAQNMRTGTMYGRGAAGYRNKIQSAVLDAQDGDTIQISPGHIYRDSTDGSGYLEGGMLHVYKSLTITNIPGRGRWQLAPPAVPYVDGRSGIIIREPAQCYADSGDTSTANPRKTIVIEGFDFSNWGRNADDLGIKVRANSGASSWSDYHSSVTFRNFKVGKLPYYPSASGFAGSAENLTFEDGHVYDCGGGINGVAGNDHNFYVTARNLTMRGVRSERTRANSADGATEMDGHVAKLTFNNADIQGCVFWCGDNGDSSISVQCKGGGNLVFRGNLVRSGANVSTATGEIVYEKESNNYGGWMFGLEGHSLLVEKNVFITHLPYSAGVAQRAMVYFRPSISGNYLDVSLITSCVIRDNIGMSTVPSSLWVPNAPPSWGDANWAANNSEMVYGVNEPGFTDDDRVLRLYRRMYGTIAAGAGSIATYRFLWPHGYTTRTDAFRGLA